MFLHTVTELFNLIEVMHFFSQMRWIVKSFPCCLLASSRLFDCLIISFTVAVPLLRICDLNVRPLFSIILRSISFALGGVMTEHILLEVHVS
jgi:hypothetical protein